MGSSVVHGVGASVGSSVGSLVGALVGALVGLLVGSAHLFLQKGSMLQMSHSALNSIISPPSQTDWRRRLESILVNMLFSTLNSTAKKNQ